MIDYEDLKQKALAANESVHDRYAFNQLCPSEIILALLEERDRLRYALRDIIISYTSNRAAGLPIAIRLARDALALAESDPKREGAER